MAVLREQAQVARLFRALGDETRVRILEQLRDGEQCVCDLTGKLDAGQSLMSFHLRTLKEAGLLRDRRQGRWVYYSLNPEVLEEMEELLGSLATGARRPQPAPRCPD